MRRREFIAGLGSAAALPAVARAQQPAMPVIGYLDSKSKITSADLLETFRAGLSEAGFVEGRNVAIEYRWAEDHLDRLPALAADLVRRRVAVIVANNASTPAAKAATPTIPIVFNSGGDPVEAGLVTNLNRPGGNVTGVSLMVAPLNPKRLELLNELVPKPAIIAMLWDSNGRNVDGELRRMEVASRALGREILVAKAGNEGEFDAAFAKFAEAHVGALFVGTGSFFLSQRRQLVALAGRYSLPSCYHLREFVEAGGLMSYGSSVLDTNRRQGIYVGRILKGEKPGELPVELPTRYELVFNLATAKALKIDIPPKLLALTDEVIQ
jgi:putative tryptophan/tyrosine transport system substrate-binding protein